MVKAKNISPRTSACWNIPLLSSWMQTETGIFNFLFTPSFKNIRMNAHNISDPKFQMQIAHSC